MSIIMEGYDLSVTGAFPALPVFREYFGTYYPAIEQWQIPAQWQSARRFTDTLGDGP
jgi:SP family general alpha glucoside:H+ symporter-like MFS transporter